LTRSLGFSSLTDLLGVTVFDYRLRVSIFVVLYGVVQVFVLLVLGREEVACLAYWVSGLIRTCLLLKNVCFSPFGLSGSYMFGDSLSVDNRLYIDTSFV